MIEKEKHILMQSLHLLSSWLPIQEEALLYAYENKDARCDYHIENIDRYHYCLFTFPMVKEDGSVINNSSFVNRSKTIASLLIQLVFNDKMEIIADCALYFFAAGQIKNPLLLDYLEKESDWLYWQSYILENMINEPIAANDLAVLYTNAYTSKAYRKQNIFHQMIQNVETFLSTREMTIYSAISLDPDVACYGEDASDQPYIYSMKDEPQRMENAKILESLGFHPVKLETDEIVEDGTLLWFAWKKTSYIYL